MLHLILHSNQIIPHSIQLDEKIVELSKKKSIRLAYVASQTSKSNDYFEKAIKYYNHIGISHIEYFDFDKKYVAEKDSLLYACDVIHLSGGDTSYFLQCMKQRNAIEKLRTFACQGGVIVGVSAGAIILTQDLNIRRMWTVDSQQHEKSLALVDFDFYPHYESSLEKNEELLQYSRLSGRTIYACSDGNGIMIKNQNVEVFGQVTLFQNEKMTILSKNN